ncbi:aspartate dehydrogenase [Phenylobacterium sp.]|uniref:aspartate dehydrogenase n=1 Tax=Phenylobacterium sp. TaxID=1871053 RepID=UPI0027319965|nr:aspartate dehydrogenase [Phenylobacterium sp.]MDP1616327.1 aspartate dehydrogenase [Phenylobacterium sp.]MDP1987169.1 aspartate dehydrogenase [Phenylobacterium sp.]
MASDKRIALIGLGAIGHEIIATAGRLGEADSLCGVLVRPGREAVGAPGVHDVAALLATAPDVVLECAGHGAVSAFGAEILAAGVDLVVSSVGALTDTDLARRLLAAEAAGGGRLLIPAGAVAGLDGLVAASLAGLNAVTYDSYKPPHAWRGTPAEQAIDLNDPADEQVFFEGTAREAAAAYPKNANVSVAVSLAGLGLDRTRVRLISSRKVTDPLGVITAEGDFGRFLFEIFAVAAPDNPKTSALTAHSLLQCARLGIGLPASRLKAGLFPEP